MASLVLGTAGAIVGGIISGGNPMAIQAGFMLGSALGAAMFPPPGQDGPRLTDLKVQASQYGTPIPIVYGTCRVTGSMIWALPKFTEHAHQEDSGSGGGGATSYTYSTSFAVSLCEGPITGVRKIWADSKLMFDASLSNNGRQNAFTSEAGGEAVGPGIMKLYLGTEDQMPDPTMEAQEGIGLVPAYRGQAYIVFTDLVLGKFGNRIPNLTFEVSTEHEIHSASPPEGRQFDPAPVPLMNIVADISNRCGLRNFYNVDQLVDKIDGYVLANNMTGRTAIEPLMQAFFFDAVESDRKVKFIKRGGPSVVTIPAPETLMVDLKS